MYLSDEAIEEFCDIWRDEYGEELDPEQGRIIAERFLETMRLIIELSDRADARTKAESTTPEQLTLL